MLNVDPCTSVGHNHCQTFDLLPKIKQIGSLIVKSDHRHSRDYLKKKEIDLNS